MTDEAPLRVRPVRAADAPALAALLDELEFPASVETVERRLAALDRAGETALVAALGGEVLGLVTLHVTPVLHRPTPVGRMTALVVASRARGRGIGRRLVEAAEDRLARAGCALIEVTSNRRREEAHAFYARLGYAITSYRFKKDLAP